MKHFERNLSVLIVEEDRSEQFIIESTIHQISRRIEVDLLRTGQQLIDFLFKDKIQRDLNRQVLPDVVLVNLSHASTELDSVQRIRRHQQFKDLPIYLFSEEATAAQQGQKALQMGATGIFQKPCTSYDLKLLIAQILVACKSGLKRELN